MEDVRELVPTGKTDLARAQAAVRAGYPAVAPVLYELVEWLITIGPWLKFWCRFRSIGAPLVPHIWRVLRSNDDVWKYWVMNLLISSLSEDVANEFRQELERLCYSPELNEKREELDAQARQLLEQFGWRPNAKPECARNPLEVCSGGSREERGGNRKTIARGMPAVFGASAVNTGVHTSLT